MRQLCCCAYVLGRFQFICHLLAFDGLFDWKSNLVGKKLWDIRKGMMNQGIRQMCVPMRLSVFSVHIPFGGIALSNDIGEFVLC